MADDLSGGEIFMFRKIVLMVLVALVPSWAAACEATGQFFDSRQTSDSALIQCVSDRAFLEERDDHFRTPLHLAIEARRDLAVLDAIRRTAGDDWADFRKRLDDKGRTALHLAARSGSADAVRWLIAWGAEVDALFNGKWHYWSVLPWVSGVSPLHLAVGRPDAPEIVSALLAGGADPEQLRMVRSNDGAQDYWPVSLFAARYAQDTRTLVALAARPGALTAEAGNGSTALHIAAAWDRSPEILQFLIEQGLSPDEKNDEGRLPLHFAANRATRPETVTLLFNATSDPCVADDQGLTPLDYLLMNPELADNKDLRLKFHTACKENPQR